MDTSRTSNSLKNMAFGIGSQMLSILMGFFTRWMFIALLGKEYLGVSGLFTNVLSLLSLANLGFDTAIIYSLYKPLAEGDIVTVKGYMRVYKRVYSIVGVTVFVLGCMLMPCLPYLINGEVTIPENINTIYFLFLLQSASSYFFSYKQSLLTASQQNRINSLYHSIFMVLRNLGEMVVLLFFHAYIPTLICMIAFQFAENAWIASVTDKKFPFLTNSIVGKISSEQKNALKENVKSLFLYKISGTIISSTDNILISKFQGLASVGLYSNYVYIVDVIRTFLSYIFYSMTASIGNYNVTESKEANEKMFYNLFFASFWLYGFTGICLGVLLNPFITLWIGADYLLPNWTVFIIIVNYYTAGVQYASTTYREVTGLFKVGKYRPLIAAIINLVVSIILAYPLGISGILLGTIISRLCVYFWYDPYIIHKTLFGQKLKHYFATYLCYGLSTLGAGVLCFVISNNIPIQNHGLAFLANIVLCAVLPNTIFFLLFRRREEFRIILRYMSVISKNIIRKN